MDRQRTLTTAQLAEELNIEQKEFVLHRKRYEAKLVAAGFDFIKEGSRKTITYTFNTEEKLSLENVKNKVKRIFGLDTEGRNATFDRYLRYVAANLTTFQTMTDREIAEAVGEYPSHLSKVRKIIQDSGYLNTNLVDPYCARKPLGSDTWEEITFQEYNLVMHTEYYPALEELQRTQPKVMFGDTEKVADYHGLAWLEVTKQTGYRYKKVDRRVPTFSFMAKLEEYVK